MARVPDALPEEERGAASRAVSNLKEKEEEANRWGAGSDTKKPQVGGYWSMSQSAHERGSPFVDI